LQSEDEEKALKILISRQILEKIGAPNNTKGTLSRAFCECCRIYYCYIRKNDQIFGVSFSALSAHVFWMNFKNSCRDFSISFSLRMHRSIASLLVIFCLSDRDTDFCWHAIDPPQRRPEHTYSNTSLL
jgi:hypothetical protein